ncbi:MAG: YggS family pyridoxal phosphate-dependent enzyme [Crocinitomicaceae bacterium]|jgi:PLP dependent protein|nr:YggS family pyridoxal phosphate-dependent enzyme [Crocinitomicaceae bacterium]MBT6029069.1 YggS family pyridoxal phosphate-dependent enzyme [Crocinitomicaceae bacterium]MBT6515025.1 YggS family pyridoxal phosphate-dependent enzyme [Crocinitomicaceae bacterium]
MITKNLQTLHSDIPHNVQLIAVSKTKPFSDIQVAYDAGQRDFGENKVQELVEKSLILPTDIRWHLIGHLQTNKVKYIAPFVHLIHAVDSIKLLKEINKQAKKHERNINCLLQFHIAQENTKFGLSLLEAKEIVNSPDFLQLENVKICGVMGMASFISDQEAITNEFKKLKEIFSELKLTCFLSNENFNEISMGMSGDYDLAIQEGSTMIRVGSKIFGHRNY